MIETSKSVGKFLPAFIAMQSEIPNVPKDGTNPHFKNAYATLEAVLNTIKPYLTKHGFAILQPTRVNEQGQNILVTMLFHASGEYIKSEYNLTTTKIEPQAQGSMLTYMKRYSLMALLSLPSEDDDAEQATVRVSPPKKTYEQKQWEDPNAKYIIANGVSNGGDYVIDFGKFKGMSTSDVDINELANYAEYLKRSAQQDGKPMSKGAQKLISYVNEHMQPISEINPPAFTEDDVNY